MVNAVIQMDKSYGTPQRDKPTLESGRKPHRIAIFFFSLNKSVVRKSAEKVL